MFLQVVSGLAGFQGRSQVKTWVFAIAKNIVRSWYRKKRFTSLFSDSLLRQVESREGIPDVELAHKGTVRKQRIQ